MKIILQQLRRADCGELTLPQLLKVNLRVIVLPVVIGIVLLLLLIEKSGL